MTRPTANILGVVVLVAVAAAAVLLYGYSAEDTPHRADFSLTDLQGQPHAMADYDGQVVVLNFWASWCKPCREEVPMLIDAQREYGERGLQILGIAVDTADAAGEFAERYDINYPVLADATEGARIQDRYTAADAPAGVLPFTAIVDRDGKVVARIAGALDHARLSDIVQPLLEKRASATKD
ncbi:TlpA disulfide reductase family protein [Salinisphaera sp.]|uniref:TlpA family protein disulfide reductase n=1 Tax=Salinisphaera sp. TaxID=1914330 RepID=UPI000C5FF6F4|nr:TlpA disulfide reductase family protein [Salinisphaera sp.]MBS64294.1 redoxin [Salinisphaera sp.]